MGLIKGMCALLGFVLPLAIMGLGIYVTLHFIIKYW